MLQTQLAVDLVEKCARLHIFASFKLSFLDAELFDHKMNTGFFKMSASLNMKFLQLNIMEL
jgi:hypothetical protein